MGTQLTAKASEEFLLRDSPVPQVSEAFLLLGVSKVDVVGVPSGSEIDPTVIRP